MPIYLPPISRRQFLKRSFAAATVLAAGGCVSEHRSDSPSWALLSDIHIAADPNRVEKDVNMTRHLRSVVGEVLEWPERPGAVLINGDLAFNAGEKGDYKAVVGLLRPLREGGLPLHLGMGNHDNRERFWDTDHLDKARSPMLERQVVIVRGPKANWFVLDSLVQTRVTPGMLGEAQLAWLAAALDLYSEKPAMVAVHHNPLHGAEGDKSSLQDTAQLLAVLRPRRQVKAYFFGHTHHWSVTRDDSGIHLVNLPPTAYVFQQGQPSGWVHAKFHAEGARLELRCLDKSHPDHGQVVNLDWRV